MGRIRNYFGHLRDAALGLDTPRRVVYNRIVTAIKTKLLVRFPAFAPYLYAVSPSSAAYRFSDGASLRAAFRALGSPPHHRWWVRHAATPTELLKMRQTVGAWPRIAIIVTAAADDSDTGSQGGLDRTLGSLQAQVYTDWELLVPAGRRATSHHADRRVRSWQRDVTAASRGHVAAMNEALQETSAPFIMFIRPGDTLAPDALWHMAQRLASGDADILYTDEDRIGPDGFHDAPSFKPDWAPETFMSSPYFGDLCVMRRALVQGVGGLRAGFDDVVEHDLALRLLERTRAIVHVPRVLCHRHGPASLASPAATATMCRALSASAQSRGRPAVVHAIGPGRFRVKYAIFENPRVAIIIPTRDRVDLLRACIESIETRSTYANFEIIVVDNGSVESATQAYLAEIATRHRIIVDPCRFNWSQLNNGAASVTDASMLLFLNNDIEVITPDWIEAMLEHATDPEVGVVGARLLYPDGRLQHAGVIVGLAGGPVHAFRHMAADGTEYGGLAARTCNWSAVTGACLMVRRTVFEAVGGFDTGLRVAFNDIDFCLRVGEHGLRTVYTAHATLTHHESASRGSLHPPEDARKFHDRWGRAMANDPHLNPNLSRHHDDLRPRS